MFMLYVEDFTPFTFVVLILLLIIEWIKGKMETGQQVQ